VQRVRASLVFLDLDAVPARPSPPSGWPQTAQFAGGG